MLFWGKEECGGVVGVVFVYFVYIIDVSSLISDEGCMDC